MRRDGMSDVVGIKATSANDLKFVVVVLAVLFLLSAVLSGYLLYRVHVAEEGVVLISESSLNLLDSVDEFKGSAMECLTRLQSCRQSCR
jgi:hypothetical protein